MKRLSACALMTLGASVLLLTAAGAPAWWPFGKEAPKPTSIDVVRQQYANEVYELQKEYDQKARHLQRKDGTVDPNSQQYKKLQNEYNAKKAELLSKHAHPGTEAYNNLKKSFGEKITNTGSMPRGPYSDFDLTVDDPGTGKAVAEQLKGSGHKVTYNSEMGCWIDHTTDSMIWEPGTPEQLKNRVSNPEGYTRAGALASENIPSSNAQYDPEGHVEDLHKKYQAAKAKGDVRTMNKILVKMQKATGVTPDPGATQMRIDADPFASGEQTLGESEQVRLEKEMKRQQTMEQEVQKARETARKQSESNTRMRKDLAKQERALGNEKSAQEYEQANEKIKRTAPPGEEQTGKGSKGTETSKPGGSKGEPPPEGTPPGEKPPPSEPTGKSPGTPKVPSKPPATPPPEVKTTTPKTPSEAKPTPPKTPPPEVKPPPPEVKPTSPKTPPEVKPTPPEAKPIPPEAKPTPPKTPPPEVKPTPPEVKPTPPEVKPTPPEVKPTPPEVKPTAPKTPPEVKPTPPEVKPTPPKPPPEVKPTPPEVKPTTPEVKPTSPEVKPTTPEGKPSPTEVKPTTPEGKPSPTEVKPTTSSGKQQAGTPPKVWGSSVQPSFNEMAGNVIEKGGQILMVVGAGMTAHAVLTSEAGEERAVVAGTSAAGWGAGYVGGIVAGGAAAGGLALVGASSIAGAPIVVAGAAIAGGIVTAGYASEYTANKMSEAIHKEENAAKANERQAIAGQKEWFLQKGLSKQQAEFYEYKLKVANKHNLDSSRIWKDIRKEVGKIEQEKQSAAKAPPPASKTPVTTSKPATPAPPTSTPKPPPVQVTRTTPSSTPTPTVPRTSTGTTPSYTPTPSTPPPSGGSAPPAPPTVQRPPTGGGTGRGPRAPPREGGESRPPPVAEPRGTPPPAPPPPRAPEEPEGAKGPRTVRKGEVKGSDGSSITLVHNVDENGRVISETRTTRNSKGEVTDVTTIPGGGDQTALAGDPDVDNTARTRAATEGAGQSRGSGACPRCGGNSSTLCNDLVNAFTEPPTFYHYTKCDGCGYISNPSYSGGGAGEAAGSKPSGEGTQTQEASSEAGGEKAKEEAEYIVRTPEEIKAEIATLETEFNEFKRHYDPNGPWRGEKYSGNRYRWYEGGLTALNRELAFSEWYSANPEGLKELMAWTKQTLGITLDPSKAYPETIRLWDAWQAEKQSQPQEKGLVDLRAAEAAPEKREVLVDDVETDALGGMIRQRSEITDRKTANGLASMGANSELQRASNVGNETLKGAKQTRDQGGQEALAIAAAGQQAVRIEQNKNKDQLLNAVINGVGAGVKTTAGHFGTEMGKGVGNKIFDSGKKETKTASTGGTGSPSGGSGGGGSSGGHSGGSPGGSQVAQTPKHHPSGSSSGHSGSGDDPGYGESVDPGTGEEYPSGGDYGVSKDPGGGDYPSEGGGTIVSGDPDEYEHEDPVYGGYVEPPEPPPSPPVRVDIPVKPKPQIICPHCGRPAEKLSSASSGYGFKDDKGNYYNRHGSIENACPACIAAWEQKMKPQ
ncbi:MAG: hypothetical protein KA248_07105 [Kiritimatiellae bacterium]|nr:hypothetical protein [Kiritimatiellia bacterium]